MINFPLATSTWDDKELKAIQSVIDKGVYTMGGEVAECEKDFAKFVNQKYCVMTSSGSTANLLAVASLFYTKNPKLQKGDEVIVPAVSWSTTYYPLHQYGLKLKFVDIDIETLNYDLHALKQSISNETKMIMVVNLLGNPNDFNEINKIIKDKDIIILEDNCESMGATYNNKYAGTFGIMGTFSTFYSHHIATMEGGFITTNDKEIYHILLSLRAHGWTRNLPKDNCLIKKSDNWFKESFRFILPGYNVRPVEMSGAIGIEQIKKLPLFLKQRRDNAKLFKDLFRDDHDFIIQKEIGNSSWFGFSFIIRPTSNKKRDNVVKKLIKNSIDCRPIVTGNFTKNDVMKYFNYEIFGQLKNADILHENGFFVGNHQMNLEKEILFLREVLS